MVFESNAIRMCLRLPAVVLVTISGIVPAMASEIDFGRDIRPLLSETCFPCHGPDTAKREADLRLDTREGFFVGRESGGPVIVPGEPDRSELYLRIVSGAPDERMPPADFEKQLSPAAVDAIRRWILQGAERQEHWAFVPAQRLAIPRVADASWPRHPVDHFVLARLDREGLAPSPEASPEQLIRRVTLDLTGLPPSIEDVDAFLADELPGAYERVVDRLLASPRFGERLAIEWLDGARYADTDGFSEDKERSMWLWRDWVVGAFNRNLPFDEFAVEQLAGDLLPNATVDQKIATGFNRNHRINREPGTIPEEWRIEYVVDRVDTTSTVWLGLTLVCARCHSHKYDPFSQREFYEIFAFFNNVPETRERDESGNSPPLLRLSSPQEEARIAELDRLLAAARETVEKLEKDPEAADDAAASAKESLNAIKEERRELLRGIPATMVMAELDDPRDAFVLLRGRYDRPGENVAPGVPAVLAPFPDGAPKNRLGLARWLTSPGHPLTARVAVNRYWQMYFGTGLVESDEDFGLQGSPPTHPELLDWLATEFVRSGWDVKRLQRLIVTSATYRQSSKATPDALARDPRNRWLARASRFRLPAESIRDQALAASGLLVHDIGGPPVKPYQPPGVWDGVAYKVKYVPDTGEKLYRRSLYTYWKRTVPPPAMTTFDAPSRETCKTRRSRTSTPLQALALMNDPTYVEAARTLARLLIERGGETEVERLRYGFRRVLARAPNREEMGVLRAALERYSRLYRNDPAAADQITSVGESSRGDRVDASELAAYTAVVSILFNLDETIARE